jgi:hypothetical protein
LGDHWSASCHASFASLTKILFEPPVLATPNLSKKFYGSTDASQYGIDVALYQLSDDYIGDLNDAPAASRRLIAFVSCTLNAGERSYSATKREILAIVFALKRLHYFFWGKKFLLFTDHHALAFMFTQTHTNPMLDGWLDTLLNYQFSVTHYPGSTNILSDALSRLCPDALRLPQVGPDSQPIRLFRLSSDDIHHWAHSQPRNHQNYP